MGALTFGIFPSPQATDYSQTVQIVQLAEALGLDYVGIQDHPYQRRFLDTFILMADLLARTERIRVFPDVANLPLRGPSIIAKMAASLDILSSGRFELGLGAGSFWEATEALGGPRRSPGEAVEAFIEAVQVIRLLWSGERGVRFEGEHYRLGGTHSGPVPRSNLQIWVGAYGPRMLRAIGTYADGWLPSSPYTSPDALDRGHAIIDEAAEQAGRDPSGIRRLYNVSGEITDGASEGFLKGPVDQWVDELGALAADHRIETFILWPTGDVEAQVRRFATEVVPALPLG